MSAEGFARTLFKSRAESSVHFCLLPEEIRTTIMTAASELSTATSQAKETLRMSDKDFVQTLYSALGGLTNPYIERYLDKMHEMRCIEISEIAPR